MEWLIKLLSTLYYNYESILYHDYCKYWIRKPKTFEILMPYMLLKIYCNYKAYTLQFILSHQVHLLHE
jgi:hypothetical protein